MSRLIGLLAGAATVLAAASGLTGVSVVLAPRLPLDDLWLLTEMVAADPSLAAVIVAVASGWAATVMLAGWVGVECSHTVTGLVRRACWPAAGDEDQTVTAGVRLLDDAPAPTSRSRAAATAHSVMAVAACVAGWLRRLARRDETADRQRSITLDVD